MEAVILIGLQGSGKSTFCRQRFFDTHVRLNLDMLRTRNREARLLAACVEIGQRFVVDNTNPTRAERVVYIAAAKMAGFRVIGYYFRSRVEDCLRRNALRPADRLVPVKGVLGTAARLERPSLAEGFEELFHVAADDAGGFAVEGWADDV